MKKQNDASCQVSKTANLIKKAWLIVMFFCITLTGVFAQTVVTVSSSGNFTIPAGVTTIKVEAWGTGGSGGGATGTIGASRGGGGGGGGAYTTNNLTVSAGQIYSITIGAQGSTGTGAGGSGGATIFTGTGGTVTANGGAGGQPTNGAGGAGGAGGTFAGGAGGTGTANNGAGGGGAAGNNAVGGPGTATTAGAGGAGSPNVAPYKGGNGAANQATSGANGLAGISPGGGGGGGRGAAFFGTANGGVGALGQVVITYTAPVCPLTTSISPTTDQSGCAGFVSNSLSATVVTSGTTGSSTTQYQWYYNTTNSNSIAGASLIAGANSATYLPLTTTAESGTRYYFCVSYATDNGCGQTNATQYLASNVVKVTVNSPPSSVVSPSTQTICSGTIVTITGTATGIGVGASSTTSTQGSGGSTTTASTTTSTLGPNPFQVYYGGDKQQMLITASELSALGMVSLGASITDWGIFMNAAGSTALSNVTIKMQNTTLTALTTTPVTTGWTTVHTLASFTPTTGVNLLTLTTPFLWNGADNLLIEVNYSNNNTGAASPTNTATYDPTGFVSTWFYRADNVTAAAMNTYSGNASFTYSARNRMRFKFKNVVNNIAPTWTATTPTLYSNALATIAYVAGTPAATVYGKPTANTTYTSSVDNKGACTVSSTSVITVNTAPTFSVCPSNQSTNATTGLCSKVVNYTATATGTPSPAISYSFSGATTGSGSGTGSGSAFNVGVTNVSITASNSCSPNATCSFTITVTDTQNPVISNCPSDISLNNDAGLCTAVATWTAPTAADNCGIQSLTASHNSGDTFPVGTTAVTYTATDVNGNIATCSFNVVITDNENPTITCPTAVTITADNGLCTSSAFIGVPITSDNCGVQSSVASPAGPYAVGSHSITWTVSDVNGNTNTCTQTVTVTDTQNPVISNCPGNINLNNDAGLCSAVATWTAPTAADNCSIQSFTSTHNSGDVLPVGTTTVTYTATDVNGNTATCSFNVVVTDNTNPVISNCPANISINNDAGLCTAVATWTAPTATDNCSIQSFTSTHNSGDVFPVGTTTVTYTATDVNGNTATCSFNVVVTDNTNPVISNCPVNISINNDAALCTAIATWTAPTAADNCSIQSLTSSHNSGDAFPVGTTTVTYTATDVNGNTATCSFNVVVVDTEIPVIVNCPANITVSNDAGTCGAVVTYTAPSATDNCAGATISGSNNSGDTFPIGTTTVTYTATDASGNTATCSFTVTVNSTVPSAPASATTNAPFDNICNGNNVLLTAIGGSLGSMGGDYKWYTGSCGGTLVGTGATITQSPVVTTTYFVRIEDNCGNSTACTSVTVTLSYAPDSANVILPFTGMPVNICTGTTATLSIAPVAGATQYTWDVPTGGYFNGNPLNVSPFTTATPTVQVTYGAPIASLYSTGVQAGNACGNSIRKGQKTRGTTSVPANVSGSLTACANTSNTYSTNVVQGATSYLWTITGNATVVGTGNTVTVNFGPSWNGGSLCVSAQTTCYTSPSKCITISKSAAVTNAITGTFTACPGSALSYSVAPSAGAASYNWTVPNHASVAGGQGTATANVSFSNNFNSAGNICVTVNSICGVASPAKCKTVAPGIPSMPNSISGPSNGLCNQTVVYTCPNQNGASFTWTAPVGATILAGQGTNSVSIQYGSFSTGPVSVKASNACGNSGNRTITVKGAPNKPTSIVATPGSWCDNTQGIEFQANTSAITGSYTMSWSYPSSPTANYVLGGGNSSSIVLDWLTGNGVLMATAYNACGSGTAVLNAGSSCREAEVKNNEADKLTVYPNPTNGVVNVSYKADKGNTTISVLDVAGRKVMLQSTTSVYGNNTVQLDMGKLAKGAYMLTIQSTQGLKQVKVVVE